MRELSELQTAVVAAIDTLLPDLAECKAHGGRFTREELAKFRVKTPSVHVALPTFRDPQIIGEGVVDVEAKIIAVISTRNAVNDGKRLERGVAALNIANAIAAFVPTGIQLDSVFPAEHIVADNLYDAGDDKQGVAMWAVHWTQKVRLTIELEDEVLPKAAYLGFAPDIGAGHVNDYKLIAGSDDA